MPVAAALASRAGVRGCVVYEWGAAPRIRTRLFRRYPPMLKWPVPNLCRSISLAAAASATSAARCRTATAVPLRADPEAPAPAARAWG